MKVNSSAHFESNDQARTISFTWGILKSKKVEVLHYSEYSHPFAKEILQDFLTQPDMRKKIEQFAHFLNFGSDDEHLHQLAFGLEVMWRYDWAKVATLVPETMQEAKKE